MSQYVQAECAILRWSALGGATLWLALAAFPVGDHMGVIELMFLLAPLTIVPLGLALLPEVEGDRWGRGLLESIARVQPLAALAATGSFVAPIGSRAGAFAAVHALVTGLVAVLGLVRILKRGVRASIAAPADLAIDIALVYLAVGGAWLVLSRAGIRPLGLEPPIVLLTAVHFHFAAFAGPLLTGLAGRAAVTERKTIALAVLGTVIGPPLVAVGFAVAPIFEVAGALAMAFGLAVLSLCIGPALLSKIERRSSMILFGISFASTIPAMIMAVGYAFGDLLKRPFVEIPTMAWTHGLLNGIGFSLLGLCAWTLEAMAPPPSQPKI